MTLGLEFYKDFANRDSTDDLLSGYGSESWLELNAYQSLLIDICVVLINNVEPIIGEFRGFLKERKARKWFQDHKDEFFLFFLCVTSEILRAHHHFDDNLKTQLSERFGEVFDLFFIEDFKFSTEGEYAVFVRETGEYWGASLEEVGLKIGVPSFTVGFVSVAAASIAMSEYLRTIGRYSDDLAPARIIRFLENR